MRTARAGPRAGDDEIGQAIFAAASFIDKVAAWRSASARLAMAAHAKRSRVSTGARPDFLHCERPGERDAGADAPLVCGRARRV